MRTDNSAGETVGGTAVIKMSNGDRTAIKRWSISGETISQPSKTTWARSLLFFGLGGRHRQFSRVNYCVALYRGTKPRPLQQGCALRAESRTEGVSRCRESLPKVLGDESWALSLHKVGQNRQSGDRHIRPVSLKTPFKGQRARTSCWRRIP